MWEESDGDNMICRKKSKGKKKDCPERRGNREVKWNISPPLEGNPLLLWREDESRDRQGFNHLLIGIGSEREEQLDAGGYRIHVREEEGKKMEGGVCD